MKKVNRKKAAIIRLVATSFDQFAIFATGLLLLPLYFSYLGVEKYGLWLASGGIVTWLSMANVTGVVGQRVAIAHGYSDAVKAASFFWSSIAVSCLLGCCVFAIGVMIGFFFERLFEIEPQDVGEVKNAYYLALVSLLVQFVTASASPFLNAIQKPISILLFRPFIAVTYVYGTYWALVSGFGLLAIPFGILVRNTLIGVSGMIFACFYALRLTGFFVCRRFEFFDLLKNTPIAVTGLFVGGSANRLQATVIVSLISAEAGALYDAANKVIMFAASCVSRVTLAFIPSFTHLYGEGNAPKVKSVVRGYLVLVLTSSTLVAGGYIIGGFDFVVLWLGADKALSREIFTLISLAGGSFVLFDAARTLSFSVGCIRTSSLCYGARSLIQLAASAIAISFAGIISVPALSIIVTLLFTWLLCLYMPSDLVSVVREGGLVMRLAMFPLVVVCLVFLFTFTSDLSSWRALISTVSIYAGIVLCIALLLFYPNCLRKIQNEKNMG